MSNDKDIDQNYSYDADDAPLDDLPPQEGADDAVFYDDEMLDDETGAEADDWDNDGSDTDEFGGDGFDDGAAKKSKRLNTIIIGGAVVVGLGILYINMSGGGGGGDVQPLPVPAQTAGTEAGQPPTRMDVIYGKTDAVEEFERDTQEKSLPDTGLMNDPGALDRLTETGAQMAPEGEALPPPSAAVPHEIEGEPPMPSPIVAPMEPAVPAAAPVPASEILPVPQTAETLPAETPSPSAGIPSAADIMKKTDAAASSDALPAAPVSPAPPPAAAAAVEAPDDAIPAVPAEAVPVADSAAPVSDPDLAAQLADISARLKAMESRLAAVETETVSKEDVQGLAAAVDTVKAQMDESGRNPAAVSDRPEAAPASIAPPPAEAEETPRRAAPRKAPSPAPAGWILKSAGPGTAIVSPRGKTEMRTVSVGDNLPGVGRITGISMESGRWIVQGTTGRVTQ